MVSSNNKIQGGKILIADESDAILEILSRILTERGFEIMKAHNGNAAWEMIQKETPDAAIFDIIMPGINGLELCKRIKNNPRFQKMPVLILTSVTSDSDLADGFWKIGTKADHFISKPFDPYALGDKVEQILAGERGEEN